MSTSPQPPVLKPISPPDRAAPMVVSAVVTGIIAGVLAVMQLPPIAALFAFSSSVCTIIAAYRIAKAIDILIADRYEAGRFRATEPEAPHAWDR